MVQKFLDRLSISDFLSAAYSDCMDTIDHLQEALPYGIELLSESITVNEKVDPTLPIFQDDINVFVTLHGHPQHLYSVVDPASHETDIFLDWQSIKDASVTGKVSILRWDNEGYVVSSIFDTRNASGLKAFVTSSGFTPGDMLSNMLSSLDISTMFADAISGIKTDANTALVTFTAKYGAKYQQLSSDARRVYDQIVAALSATGNGYAGVVTFLVNIYRTFTGAKQVGTNANGYIQFNENDYYVQSFFDSVRASKVLTNIGDFLGTILAFVGTPIMKVIGLTTMGISALADTFTNIVCDSGAKISMDALNNLFAKPIYQNSSLLSRLEEINTPWEQYVAASIREKGVLSTVLPGLHIIQWYSEDDRGTAYVNTECYIRLDADMNATALVTDNICDLLSKSVQVGSENCTGVYGSVNWTILDGDLTKYKNICSTINAFAGDFLDRAKFAEHISYKEDGSLTEESDAYVFNTLMRNLILGCSWLMPHILTGPGADQTRASLNTKLADPENLILYIPSRPYTQLEQAVQHLKLDSSTSVYQFFNALLTIQAIPFTTDGNTATDPSSVISWQQLSNKIITSMQELLEPVNPFTLCTLCGALGFSGDWVSSSGVDYTVYTAWTYPESVAVSSFDIPDRNAPFVNPPQYSKGAFLASVLIGIAVIAASVAIAVTALKITRYVQLRIQKRFQEVERLRYAYQDDPSDTNWAAYVASLRGYNRLALFTGQSKLSLLTGWEISGAENASWFESIEKSIDGISAQPSTGRTISDVYRAIVGLT